MQVFVPRAALVADQVPIIATYPDTPSLAVDFHGSAATMFSLPPEAIDPNFMPPQLVTNFRDNMLSMCQAEAQRRINLVFPDYMQRNCNADINRSTTLYGADSSTWPTDAQSRKAENDRGWYYVSQVRQSSDALGAQTATVDPTDNLHWPPDIAPIYIPPV
jgi:hypothetical protein